MPVLGFLQKSLYPQKEGWAEPRAWPIKIAYVPHTAMDSGKTQSEPVGLNYGNVRTLEPGRV